MITWKQLEGYCSHCRRCKLAVGRTHVVVGDGNKNADIMFIGEGPGQQEDLQGLPFVGPAGKLFDKMLAAIDLDRSKVYICNVVKCRPPKNRDPETDEKEACLPLLRSQVALVKPKIIVCLGRIAAQVVIKEDFRITREHGIWEERKGYWLSATYHPSALLRDPAKKRDSWEDLKKLRQKIIELGIFPDYGSNDDTVEAVAPQENAATADELSAVKSEIAEINDETHDEPVSTAVAVNEPVADYLEEGDLGGFEEDYWSAGQPAGEESPFDDIDFESLTPVEAVGDDSDEIELNILGF